MVELPRGALRFRSRDYEICLVTSSSQDEAVVRRGLLTPSAPKFMKGSLPSFRSAAPGVSVLREVGAVGHNADALATLPRMLATPSQWRLPTCQYRGAIRKLTQCRVRCAPADLRPRR